MTKQCCGNCHWWRSNGERERAQSGACWRMPPCIEIQGIAVFPETYRGVVCGEHKPLFTAPANGDAQ